MSTYGGAAEKTGFALLAFVVLWPFFGWLGDIHVEKDQNIFEKGATWSSALFHVFGAIVAGLFFPIWGLIWGLFAGLVYARRLGARHGFALSPRQTISYVNVKVAPVALAIAATQPVIGFWKFIGSAAVVVFIGTFIVAGNQCVKATAANRAVYDQWTNRLATLFGIQESVLLERAGLTLEGSRLIIDPTPDVLRAKFASMGPANIDAALAAVSPDFELASGSTHECIILQPVSEATLSRRQSLNESGGLFTNIGQAESDPVVTAPVVPSAQPKEASQPLVLNLEDL